MLAKLVEIQENLKIIDHKIDVYRGSLAAGDADRLWAPVSTATPEALAAHVPAQTQPDHAHAQIRLIRTL